MNQVLQNRALELLHNRWDRRSVLVVGDLMVDKYLWGSVDRISPEAPVPVVRGFRSTHGPGGAANVAMNLAGLGAHAIVAGFVGDDEDAAALGADLRSAGIAAALVSVRGFPTTSKLRILGGNQQMLRVDVEVSSSRPDWAYDELVRQSLEALPSCSAVVLSDYAKGALNDFVCASIIREARALGIPVLVDPKSATFAKYRNATTVCPNLRELSAATGDHSGELDQLLDSSARLVNEFRFDFLTVTLAERGIAVVEKSGARKHAAATTKQVFDVSGAGDTVIATLALCLASKLDIETAIELANHAAGIVISKVGTVPIERNEVIGLLTAEFASREQGKILSRDALRARVASWRAAGHRIVFTNGCYDLLHAGHIHVLERARMQGDHLVVAINSDDSVRRLKGPSRPMVGEQERAGILAALSAVDAVVIFDESTPLDLIRALRPDVLVKGGDYTAAEVVGAAEVRSWGGRVSIVPLIDGFSTSGRIAQVRERTGLYPQDLRQVSKTEPQVTP